MARPERDSPGGIVFILYSWILQGDVGSITILSLMDDFRG
jgi:hypothetical protein